MQNCIFIKDNGVGSITANRNARNNWLTPKICEEFITGLSAWIHDDEVELVLLDQFESNLGIFAGIDFRALALTNIRAANHINRTLKAMFELYLFISSYPKPIVSLMDGVTRSSGVGIVTGTHFRVATEKTIVYLPDTGLGFAPTAGTSRVLSGLPSQIGTWLAFTGSRITGREAFDIGLATHYCASHELNVLRTELRTCGIAALDRCCATLEPREHPKAREIKELFSGDSAKEIKDRLLNGSDWAKSQATRVVAKSPLSLKIALRQIRTAEFLDSLEGIAKLEYRIASRLARTENFREGVRAALIEMDYCPNWRPGTFVTATHDVVSEYFMPLDELELKLPKYNDHQKHLMQLEMA
nr:enoyl-CoA hydratase/isomerase family protein [Hyphomonas sp. Mor2]